MTNQMTVFVCYKYILSLIFEYCVQIEIHKINQYISISYTDNKNQSFGNKIENELVEFNCTPFTVSEVRRLDCQFGKQK